MQYGIVPVPEQPKKKKFQSWVNLDTDTDDLFEFDPEEELDTEDVISVDVDKDVLDADPDGSLNSVTDVTDEDMIGDELYGQSPLADSYHQKKKKEAQQIQKVKRTYLGPPPISGLTQ